MGRPKDVLFYAAIFLQEFHNHDARKSITTSTKGMFRSFCIAKLQRASEFTVLQEFHIHDARTPRTPQVAKSMLR